MSATCRSCKAPIFWLKTQAGANMPTDPQGVTPEDLRAGMYDPKRHQSHYATCPQSKEWKAKKAGR